MDTITALLTYLVAHGVITVGATIAFVVRVEHRLTKLETMFDLALKNPGILKKSE